MSDTDTHAGRGRAGGPDGDAGPTGNDGPAAPEEAPAAQGETGGEEEAGGALTRDEADAREIGAAGSQLSTAPREEPLMAGPRLGPIGWARWFWRQLTSMRIALLLLLLLSLAAIPGSLIPQSSADQNKVDTFITEHTTLGPLYDKLQLFHVYSSVWFSAIYILLFISLIGCIIPRTWQFVGQLRGRPPGAPGRLTRLPAYTTWRTDTEPEAVREAALAVLGRRRFRVHVVGDAVAAEKGYLREAGNLMFHVALIVMLLAFASGSLFKSEGGKLIMEGDQDGFSNTLSQYDDFTSGSLFDSGNLAPFSFSLDNFIGTYERSGPEVGTARKFQADIHYSAGPGDKEHKGVIKENHPLKIEGSNVYLISHGYAPSVTVKDGRGKVVFHGATPMLPFDKNLSSSGAIKVMDGYRDKSGKKDQLGFAALFVPTFGGKGQMLSQFPAPDFPVLNIGAYHGDLGVDSGVPQNVYQLNTKVLKPFKDAKGQILKQSLLPGETMKLPDGAGSITFDKGPVKEWASFQITHQPGELWALGGAIAAILGLAGSLFIQRRRVWVKAVTGPDGVTVLEMAGLGRSESAKLPEELGDLAVTLIPEAPPAPDPDADDAGEASAAVAPADHAEGAEK
ncbi:cytochrome c biogenesis protein ResB [Streptomyces sp. 8L]|uniref:cytochrome c biogenesis protein ResB n=1 Tax=Streptomyces sp. 8L TaxID=2877242 RepID=UPI001CD374B2|nr:cytochrome c biogenesis protein ResB [Streptomyces sp. 8L]MCA1223366.1 cytochrome c biogenesis protein ResB [Streptomyces sp. 8L]